MSSITLAAVGSSHLKPINIIKPCFPTYWKPKFFKKETQIQNKPRFLCLHGFRTSAEILQKQVRRWPETVLGKLDLVFVDGPFLAQGKSGVERFYNPPYYEWFQFSQDYQEAYNFEECLAYIEDYMVRHGPFDGLMGFSQGAILSAAMPGMQLDGVALTKVPKIKCVIIMSGAKFGGSNFGSPKQAANAFSSPLKCPSLHIIGEADLLKEQGIELLESFVDPFLVHHSKGHTIARLDEKGLKTILSFIETIEKIHSLDDGANCCQPQQIRGCENTLARRSYRMSYFGLGNDCCTEVLTH